MRFAAVCFGASAMLCAAVFPRLTAEELTAQSPVIVQGTVVRSWVAWDANHRFIWTHYEISLSDVIRGPRAASITVSEPGGELDDVGQRVSGSISYTPGESDILFLFQTPGGYWRTMGGPQGKFVLESGGRVHGGAEAAVLADRSGRASAGTALSSLDGLTVAAFKSRVRQLAADHPYRSAQ